jgi:mannose-6-phosphate isomerase-like protein (cupin superfamily)
MTNYPVERYSDGRKPTDQKLVVSHLESDADFKNDGIRPYALYRDLGLADATNGMIQAHVIRMVPPCTDDVRKRHYHDTQFQMTYIIRGWMKIEFEGHGEVVLKAGSLAMLPQRIKHTVLDYSDDCEQIEIIMPAQFDTINTPDG